MAAIVLDGFVREVGKGLITEEYRTGALTQWNNADYTKSNEFVRLTSDDIVIAVDFPSEKTRGSDSPIIGIGHTWFKAGDHWFTFDRRGFEDSFYLDHPSPSVSPQDIPTLLLEQVMKARTSITEGPRILVPGAGGIMITMKHRLELSQNLLNGRIINLSPGGMGQGFQVKTDKRGMASYAELDFQMAQFFGVRECYKQAYDHD